MLGFVVRRLAVSLPLLAVASFAVFALVASTGDPLGSLRSNPRISQETIELRERELHLDEPIPVRYGIWISDVLGGDLGTSSQTGEEVSTLLLRRLGVTLRLVLFATFVAVVVGVAVGVVSAVRQYSLADHASTFLAFLFFSMPTFWLAAVLKDLGIRANEALGRRLFFTVGEATPDLAGGVLQVWGDRLGHLVLPALTLVLIQFASWSRYQRASMLDVLNADYVRTARGKGLGESRVLVRHALRNALIPVVTVVAIDFGTVLGGAVITEVVFGWKGMGLLLVEAVRAQDVNVVQAWLLVTATVVIVFNLLADIVYGYLDPRIRRG